MEYQQVNYQKPVGSELEDISGTLQQESTGGGATCYMICRITLQSQSHEWNR